MRERGSRGSVGRSVADSGTGEKDSGPDPLWAGLGFPNKENFPILLKQRRKEVIWEIKSNPNIEVLYIKMIREINAI